MTSEWATQFCSSGEMVGRSFSSHWSIKLFFDLVVMTSSSLHVIRLRGVQLLQNVCQCVFVYFYYPHVDSMHANLFPKQVPQLHMVKLTLMVIIKCLNIVVG